MSFGKPLLFIMAMTMTFSESYAQRRASVHGTYTYVMSDNDNVTLRDAKHRSIELAKAAAIKNEFGELVASDVMESSVEKNGVQKTSLSWMDIRAMAKGDWLMDEQPPVVDIKYKEGKLYITAEVWGKAREIVQGKADLKWDIQKMNNGKLIKAKGLDFNNGESLRIHFRTPVDGYVAVYLITGDDKAYCLLPYKKDTDGKYPVVAGKDYRFFDKTTDSMAQDYYMGTDQEVEDNQIIVIFSPNPFTKCNDIDGGPQSPNFLTTGDFQKWLLKSQRLDKDMQVDKRWVRIHQVANNK